MHVCGFDFDVVNMEDDSFFLEDRFSTFDRDLKNKKVMVPMKPEGVHGQPLGLPDYHPFFTHHWAPDGKGVAALLVYAGSPRLVPGLYVSV